MATKMSKLKPCTGCKHLKAGRWCSVNDSKTVRYVCPYTGRVSYRTENGLYIRPHILEMRAPQGACG